MKKVLIRAGMCPFDDIPFSTMIQENILGTNIGNLVYTYSIFKNLMQGEKTEFVAINTRKRFSQDEIDQFNRDCECFLIPLADFIRPDTVKELQRLTQMIRSLTIPCYVIGVGVRTRYDPDPAFHYAFDSDVADFMNAILEKSAMVGLRGSITADYLSRLGYIPEKDFTVIGCPSMYTFGRDIHIRDEQITADSTVCYNMGAGQKDNVLAFIRTNADKFARSYYIPQDVEDLKIMYGGIPRSDGSDLFPKSIADTVFMKGNARFFPNVPSWIHFLEESQFSFGSRLHGNIVSILAGTPALFFPHDGRERELAEYHDFPVGGTPKDRLDKNVDIFELIAKSDFHSVEKMHSQNFDHYLDFLKINGIPHVYGEKTDVHWSEKNREAACREPLKPMICLEPEELAKRLNETYTILNNKQNKKIENLQLKNDKLHCKVDRFEKEAQELKKEVENLKKINASQEIELNSRSVKLMKKLKNALGR